MFELITGINSSVLLISLGAFAWVKAKPWLATKSGTAKAAAAKAAEEAEAAIQARIDAAVVAAKAVVSE